MSTTKSKTKSNREPFNTLYNQGMILGPDNQKMSKSKGNVINPDDVIKEYGVDCLRMYEMFMGPYEDNKPWSTSSIKGVYRFLDKIWAGIETITTDKNKENSNPKIFPALNNLVKNIDEKIPNLQFNTCVSDFMKFWNEFSQDIYKDDLKVFLKLLFPFAPIISAEGLSRLGEADYLDKYYNYQSVWPQHDENTELLSDVKIKIMIQNKFRGEISGNQALSESQILELVKTDEKYKKYLPEKISKVFYVENKIFSIV